MLRIGILASAAVLAVTTGSLAADLPTMKGPPPAPVAPVFTWTGFYIGANVGGAWGSTNFEDNNAIAAILGIPASQTIDAAGFTGGVQAGYNWQNGPWVFGVEGDFQATGAEDTFAPWKFSNPWFGTVRGRVGYALNNVLFYGTGGLAFGELRGETFGLSETHTNVGWTAGVGAEVGLTQNWSAKIEYLYVDLASSNFTSTGVPNSYRFGTVRARVNYHF